MEPKDLMKPFLLEIIGGEDTPKVSFNSKNHVLLVRGESKMENTTRFYGPLLSWLSDYYNYLTFLGEKGKRPTIRCTIDISYMNSGSAKYVFQMISAFNKLDSHTHVKVVIDWHYDQDDEDAEDMGEEISSELNMDFNFVKGGSV